VKLLPAINLLALQLLCYVILKSACCWCCCCCCCLQWCSSYGAEFVPSKADLSANKAMAAAVSNMFNGPTIAWGKIAGIRAGDAAGIAKWKAQQEAAAAAKAAQEAALDRRAAAGAASGVAAAAGAAQ
jgi:hypothetical protein